MVKKWIALALSMVLLLTVLPLDAWAEPEATAPTAGTTEQAPAGEETQKPEAEPEPQTPKLEPLSPAQAATPTHKLPTKAARIQRLRYYIQWDHQNALEQESAESLAGYCGLLAGYQLFYRGITSWRRSYNGKDYYDAFSAMHMTDGGYTVRAYNALKDPPKAEEEKTQEELPAQEGDPVQTPAADGTAPETPAPEPAEPERYSIEQILNQVTNNGSKEVYNILVCFDRTNTAAGSVYGHVVFVYGIIDGIVYYTEAGNDGKPFENTISQFSASYASWTELEGIVVLGNKDFMDNCDVYTCNMFATCTDTVPLYPLPSQAEITQTLRSAGKGERLQVIGLYQNRDLEYYYEVFDGDAVCYAPTHLLQPMLFLYDPFILEDPDLPQILKPGKDFRLDGTIRSANYMSRVIVTLLDAQGTVVQEYSRQVNDSSFDLYNWDLNKAIDFAALPEGLYTCRVVAEACNWFDHRGDIAKRMYKQVLAEQLFAVGEDVTVPAPVELAPEETVKDGWCYEQQTWYCYDQGTPLTGWQQADGIWYYLKEDGSVTTGGVLVDGLLRQFTATGALRTGWVESGMGRQYFYPDGTPAHGWLQLDGAYYYFDDLGVWQENHMRVTLNKMAMLDITDSTPDGQPPVEE